MVKAEGEDGHGIKINSSPAIRGYIEARDSAIIQIIVDALNEEMNYENDFMDVDAFSHENVANHMNDEKYLLID